MINNRQDTFSTGRSNGNLVTRLKQPGLNDSLMHLFLKGGEKALLTNRPSSLRSTNDPFRRTMIALDHFKTGIPGI